MKTMIITMTTMLLVGGFVYSKEHLDTTEKSVDLVVVSNHEEPIKFVEQGVEFLIYPYGDFDYKKRVGHHDSRNSINVGIKIPGTGIHVGSSKSIGNNEAYVKYNEDGKIIKIGHAYVDYDYSGRISQAGNVYIAYNRKGLVSDIGGLHVYYDYSGEIVRLDGYVNPYDYKKGYGHNFYYKKDLHHTRAHANNGLHVQKGHHGVKVHKNRGGFQSRLSLGHHKSIKKKHHGHVGHGNKVIVKKHFSRHS